MKRYGHISRLVPAHGFGFLVDDHGLEWFFVAEDVRGGSFDEIWPDERVGFSEEWTVNGPRAVGRPLRNARRLSLLLFDIDGTLLLTAGAGIRGMTRAFDETFGVARRVRGIPARGPDRHVSSVGGARTRRDRRIRRRPTRVSATPTFRRWPTRSAAPATGRFGVMPGVEALLAALRAQTGWHLALLTGNYERAAQMKLRHFGLDRFFEWGVYGEESSDRRDLSRIALERARARDIPEASCAGAVVIGDTPDDVACAHAVGARLLAVATGPFSLDELTAAGAHTALVDLSDTDAVLRVLR